MDNCCNCKYWRGIDAEEYEKCDNSKQRKVMESSQVRFDFGCSNFVKENDTNIKEWQEQFGKDRGNCLGYTGEECTQCGRVRVEAYENGDKICEKCHWNETTKEYENSEYC